MSYPPHPPQPGPEPGFGSPGAYQGHAAPTPPPPYAPAPPPHRPAPPPQYQPPPQYREQPPPAQQQSQQGGGELCDSPLLVYDQPQEFFSVEAKYTIWNPQGRPVAFVREQPVDGARKALRVLSQGTQNRAERRLHIVRPDGMPYFMFYKPYGFAGTPVMHVLAPQGQVIGYLRKRALRGWEILDPYERELGYYDIYSGRIQDWNNRDAAHFQRGVQGFGDLMHQMFTGADRYTLQLHFPLAEPFRTLVLACPLAFDTALSQNRSLGGLFT